MLDGADAQPQAHELGDELLDQRRLAGVALADDGDQGRLGGRLGRALRPGLALRLPVVVHGVDVTEARLVWKGHLDGTDRGQDVDDAVAAGVEHGGHRRQAGGAVGREQGLTELPSDRRQGGVVTGKGGEDPQGGLLVRPRDVDGEHEHRLVEVPQGSGDAGERRARRPGIVEYHIRARVAEIDVLIVAEHDRDAREELAQKGEVAQQQRAPLEHEEAFVDAGAAAAAAGDEDADVDLRSSRRLGHGGVSVPVASRRVPCRANGGSDDSRESAQASLAARSALARVPRSMPSSMMKWAGSSMKTRAKVAGTVGRQAARERTMRRVDAASIGSR